MILRDKSKSHENEILILALLLIVVLFLIFSLNNNREIERSPDIDDKLSLEKQTVVGNLMGVHTDYHEFGPSKDVFYLEVDGDLLPIDTSAEIRLSSIPNGARIQIEGKMEGQNLIPQDIKVIDQPHIENLVNNKTVLVLLAKFQNETYEPWTTTLIRNRVFDSLTDSAKDYFLEESFGKYSISGNVIPDTESGEHYFVLQTNSTCNWNQIRNAFSALLSEFAPDYLDDYNVTVLMIPMPCYAGVSWGGHYIWISVPSSRVITHELGHNMGYDFGFFGHANGLECGTSAMSNNCVELNGKDEFDVMGEHSKPHMRIDTKKAFEWLNQNQIINVEVSGVYSLEPTEVDGNGIKMIVIPRGIREFTLYTQNGGPYLVNESLYHYLEYRRGLGYDRTLLNPPYINISDGVLLIHSKNINLWPPFPQLPTRILPSQGLVDTTPESIPANATHNLDFFDAGLNLSRAFIDYLDDIDYEAIGPKITISIINQSSEFLNVEILFGLFINPSFEIDSGIDFYPNWNQDDTIANNYKPDGYVTSSSGLLDSNVKYQGSKSIKLTAVNNRAYSYQDIPVEYNKRYRVSGYVKTDCNDNNCYGTILSECEKQDHTPIWDYNNCKLNINPINIRRLYNDNNWTYIEFEVENNRQDAAYLRVLCYNTPGPLPVGSGVVWCDSFNVIEIPRGGGGSPLFLKPEQENLDRFNE